MKKLIIAIVLLSTFNLIAGEETDPSVIQISASSKIICADHVASTGIISNLINDLNTKIAKANKDGWDLVTSAPSAIYTGNKVKYICVTVSRR